MANSTSLFALRAEHFRDQIGKLFHLETRSGAYPMPLIDVWEGAEPLFSGTERRPFTLRFLGPPAARVHWRGIPFYLQRAVNHQVYLSFEDRAEVEFVGENPDIGTVRVTGDGIQVFTRSVGGEGSPIRTTRRARLGRLMLRGRLSGLPAAPPGLRSGWPAAGSAGR